MTQKIYSNSVWIRFQDQARCCYSTNLTHCPLEDLDAIFNIGLLIGMFRSDYDNYLGRTSWEPTDDK